MTFNISNEDKNKFGIYKILDIEKGKYYFGSTDNFYLRFRVHRYRLKRQKHHNYHLQNIFNLRSEKLIFIIEEIMSNTSQLIPREQEYLDKTKSDPFCINIAKIAGGGNIWSSLTLEQRISQKQKEIQTKKENGTLNSWIFRSKESQKASLEGMVKANTGAKRTFETKEKMRQAKLGTKRSEEAKRKTSETLKVRYEENLIPFEVFKDGILIGIYKRQKDFYNLGMLSNVSISELLLKKRDIIKGYTAKYLQNI